GGLGDQEGAAHVHGDHVVEVLDRHLAQGLVPQDARVVDHDVDLAEGLDRGGDDRAGALGGGDVVGAGYRLPAVLVDQLRHVGGGTGRGAGAVERAAEVVDDHLGAPLGQQQRV